MKLRFIALFIFVLSLFTTSCANGSPVLTSTPTSYSFGSVVVGSSATQSFTFTNTGNQTFKRKGVAISGPFTVKGTVPKSIAPGASFSIQIVFSPTSVGSFSTTLRFSATNATTLVVPLSGSGVAASTQPNLVASVSSINFGSGITGQPITSNLTLTNIGTASATISGFNTSNSAFVISGIVNGEAILPGSGTSMAITFTPTSATTYSGTATISSNASPVNISLTGAGLSAQNPILTASATNVNMGTQIPYGQSISQVITLSSSGTSPVTISGLNVVGSLFGVSGISLPLTLNPGQTTPLTLLFNAPTTAGGPYTGILTISSNAPAVTVNMSASTVAPLNPVLTVDSSTINFGQVIEGQKSTQTVNLSAAGGAVTISGLNSAGSLFTLSGINVPTTINAGQTIPLNVTFSPSGSSNYTSVITITNNSSSGNLVVNAAGQGLSHRVQLNWNAPASSSDPIVGYNVYRATGTSTAFSQIAGDVSDTSYLDTSVIGGTNYVYYVTSLDAAGLESSPSNSTSATVPLPTP